MYNIFLTDQSPFLQALWKYSQYQEYELSESEVEDELINKRGLKMMGGEGGLVNKVWKALVHHETDGKKMIEKGDLKTARKVVDEVIWRYVIDSYFCKFDSDHSGVLSL